MKKLIAAPILAGALVVGTGAATHAEPARQAPAQASTDNNDDSDKTGLWGLLGLLGLAGLAGLKRRDHRDEYSPANRTTTSRT